MTEEPTFIIWFVHPRQLGSDWMWVETRGLHNAQLVWDTFKEAGCRMIGARPQST